LKTTIVRRVGQDILALVLPLTLIFAGGAGAAERADFDVTLPAVQLREGVTADVHFAVFVNEAAACEGKVVLAVHGVAHTAASWQPLAESLFADNPTGRKVCQVVAVDLPGHGASALPSGMLFGELQLADYVAVVRASLEKLPRMGIRPNTLIGHSQGGLVIQLAQQSLLAEGRSLRSLHVKDVVLLASAGPAEIPWNFLGMAPAILNNFLAFDPALGPHVAIPDVAWPVVFFTDPTTGAVVGAPPAADVARYNSREPLYSSLELLGLSGFSRPSLPAGTFAAEAGTALQVITLERDMIVRPEENVLLYEHLTGVPATDGVAVVTGPLAVHDMHVAAPGALLAAIAGTVTLP
jgi:pimeloyl-ACP methyl ester carboxylesterase